MIRARHICAIAGIGIAAGTVIFMRSLVATNDYQSAAVAEKMLSALPVEKGSPVANLQLDYRPGGHVMQGPPLTASIAVKSGIEGVEVAKSLFAQRRLEPPEAGTELTLVGRNGAYKVKIAKVLEWDRPVRGYPNMFVPREVADGIDEMWGESQDWTPETLAPLLTSDAGGNFDKARVLLLWAAALTALCLLVNSLFLSIEAKRRDIAIERVLGATRGCVVRKVCAESAVLALAGLVLGALVAIGALHVYVALDREMFPMGASVPASSIVLTAVAALLVSFAAVLASLKTALGVRPLEAASARAPRRRHFGMLISFAFGFGAFVAVEVWGSSLMSAFVPSLEWPDAIVSILPGGTSSFDAAKLENVEGVSMIAELQPLQVNILPLEEIKGPKPQPAETSAKGGARANRQGDGGRSGPPGRGPMKQYRNALLLASDHLPAFRFVAGSREECARLLGEGDNCVITEMMARARNLKPGDSLDLDCGRGFTMSLRIVGIVDLNWHMVTSRGLVRGLNRMPVHTDGPVFTSFDTLAACDARPQEMVAMTHLWLDYAPEFVKEAGGVFEAGRIVERRIVEALDGAYGTDREGHVRGNTVRLHARDEISDGTLAHGNDLIGTMARVPFVFIAVVSLGFIAMTVASAEARKREFRVLRTVGATRGQLAKALSLEALKVAGGGIVAGFVFGALAGWLFTFSTRAMMGAWGLPPSFSVPWPVVAKGAAGAVVFALAVAVPSAMAVTSRRG